VDPDLRRDDAQLCLCRKKTHSLIPSSFEILNDIQLPPKRPLR
jgi:hypothetical protein